MKKVTNKQPNAKECFVCGVSNDKGLHAKFFETNTGEIAAVFTPHPMHQSYPDRVHGGIAACILDETIGRAVQIRQPEMWGVTVELNVCYKKPLPYGRELKAFGRITSENRLMFEGEGEILTPEGEVAVTAKAKYVKMRIDQITEEYSDSDWRVHLDIDDPTEV